MGFTAFSSSKGMLARTQPLAPSAEPESVALYVQDFRQATNIIVFNDGFGAAVVDVFEVAVLVRPPQ
jgi:hypothetical protein